MSRDERIIEDLHERLQRCHETINRLYQERDELNRRFNEMCKTVANSALHQPMMIVNDTEGLLASLYKERDELKSLLESKELRLQSALADNKHADEVVANLNKDRTSLIHELADTKRANEKLQEKIGVAERRIDSMSLQLATYAAQVNSLKQRLKDVNAYRLVAVTNANRDRDEWKERALKAEEELREPQISAYAQEFTHARQLEAKNRMLQAELNEAKAGHDGLLKQVMDLQRKNTHLQMDLVRRDFEKAKIPQGIFNTTPTKENSNANSHQPRHNAPVRSEGISGTGRRTVEWTADAINVRIESASNSRTFRDLERAVSVVFRNDRITAAAHREWHEFADDCNRQAEVDEKSKGQTGRRWNIFGGGK